MSFSKLATRSSRAATCDPDHLCVRASRLRRTRVDVARRRARAAAVLVRPRAPLRERTTPRRRSWCTHRQRRSRTHGGCGVLCRDGAGRRQDGLDPGAVRIYGHACPPRVDRGDARRARKRSVRRGNRRPERRGRSDRPVRVLRGSGDERSAGLRRSSDLAALACRVRPAAGPRAGSPGSCRRSRRGRRGRGSVCPRRCRAVGGSGRKLSCGEQRCSSGGDPRHASSGHDAGERREVGNSAGGGPSHVGAGCICLVGARESRRPCGSLTGCDDRGRGGGSDGPATPAGGRRPSRATSSDRPSCAGRPLRGRGTAGGGLADNGPNCRRMATPWSAGLRGGRGLGCGAHCSAPEAARHAPYHGFR